MRTTHTQLVGVKNSHETEGELLYSSRLVRGDGESVVQRVRVHNAKVEISTGNEYTRPASAITVYIGDIYSPSPREESGWLLTDSSVVKNGF